MTSPRMTDAVRFGIEEEFVLLDDTALAPLAQEDDEREGIGASLAGARALGGSGVDGGAVVAEYLTCQVECITPPLTGATDAGEQLRRLRGLAHSYAVERGAVLAPSGTPFVSSGGFTVTPSPHYDEVSAHLAEITRDHEVNGLHIHVEVPDEEERVRALVRMRVWLPVLLGLTTNSPFAHGRHSGFESWRSILIRRLPSSWTPPAFADISDYRAGIDGLVAMGAITGASSLAWGVRLSERFPTVEVRVCDTQLSVDDTLLAALLVRALIVSAEPVVTPPVDVVDAALWTAARHGIRATVIDPRTGDPAALRDVTSAMLDHLRPVLSQFGDEERVVGGVARALADGTGSHRQAQAYATNGIDGLRQLYRRGTEPS